MPKAGPRSTPAFGAVFTRGRILMIHSMLDFPENERIAEN